VFIYTRVWLVLLVRVYFGKMESYIGSMLSVEGACALSIVLRGLRCVLRVRFGARLGAVGPGQILLNCERF
jgi:hypothetical protein